MAVWGSTKLACPGIPCTPSRAPKLRSEVAKVLRARNAPHLVFRHDAPTAQQVGSGLLSWLFPGCAFRQGMLCCFWSCSQLLLACTPARPPRCTWPLCRTRCADKRASGCHSLPSQYDCLPGSDGPTNRSKSWRTSLRGWMQRQRQRRQRQRQVKVQRWMPAQRRRRLALALSGSVDRATLDIDVTVL